MWDKICTAKVPIIIGFIALFFVYAGFNAGSRDLSDMSLVSGNITVNSGAVDDEFGVATNAPVMIRVVEMNQYVKSSEKSYKTEYADHHLPSVELGDYTYFNPAFPKITNPKYFYGEAVIGDDNLKISDELLSKFTFEKYIYFEDSYRGEDYYLPRSFQDPTGNDLVISGGMIQSNDSSYDVGHIRIVYYTGTPKADREYSVYGNIEGDTIGIDSISAIYDKAMDESNLQELNNKFAKDNNRVGIVALIITIICFGIAYIIIKKG